MRILLVLAIGAALFSANFMHRMWPQSGASEAKATPLILENNEGELRERRPRKEAMASARFFIKVDRRNGGSRQMWMGAESLRDGHLTAYATFRGFARDLPQRAFGSLSGTRSAPAFSGDQRLSPAQR